jgi:hypothetical protein
MTRGLLAGASALAMMAGTAWFVCYRNGSSEVASDRRHSGPSTGCRGQGDYRLAHQYDVYVSTGGWIEHVLRYGPPARIDMIELSVGFVSIPSTICCAWSDRYITTAQSAANRAAALTHWLPAFSRRQTLDSKPIDVNRLMAGMVELIRRTVGREIAAEVLRAAGCGRPALAKRIKGIIAET